MSHRKKKNQEKTSGKEMSKCMSRKIELSKRGEKGNEDGLQKHLG